MNNSMENIADSLGADVIGQVPETGGGTFGVVRLAHCVEPLKRWLISSSGKQTGRPSDPS